MASNIITLEQFPAYLSTQKNLSRYDPTSEKKPNHVWYRLDKPRINELLKTFSLAVIELLNGSPDGDHELQHLLRSATGLANVVRSPAVKVALIGAQGAGKSLSLNALFDCDGLSLTGADGAACTSSITRYAHYSGEFRFAAEIKFLNAGKREALLKEHARSYYHYQHADEDSDDEDEPRSRSTHHDGVERRQKDTAEDVFLTLFGSLDVFQESWSATAYRSGEFVRICQMKCEEAIYKEGGGSGTAIKFAENQKDLVKQLKPFLTEVKGVTCLWPLVDHVTVKFNNELLQSGIEIIDLPGWGDVNLSRVRHAEEIKDTVDVEIILADTIRIASDDKVISSARAAVAHHGAANVKMVATKIDAISNNQMSQYTGGNYDGIVKLIQDTEQQDAQLDEDEDDETLKKKNIIDKYKSYLDRILRQTKVSERAEDTTAKLAAKLQSRNAQNVPETFHTSASDYMEWIKPSKISFKNQPSLPVEMTGIPALRNFLYSLPADQNLKDYDHHINTILPVFIEKIVRTVVDSGRDGGFLTIANKFDDIRKAFMARLLSQAKSSFQSASDHSISKIQVDVPNFKEQITDLFLEDWNELKSAAFNRILKCRGTVPQGVSKARGLENGANWNKELANILAPAFHKWSNTYAARMITLKPSLAYAFNKLHEMINSMMDDSTANLPTVEKARKKWIPFHHKVQAKLLGLAEAVARVQARTFEWATLQFDKENNLIAHITDDIYVEVFNTLPALKPVNPKAKKQYKQYVEPKLKFQKNKLAEMFLHGEKHFVDIVINHFQGEFDKAIRQTLMEHFAGIEKLFEDFSASLRSQIPINYLLESEGKAIRAEVKERIPELEQKVAELRALLPVRDSQEHDDIEFDNIDVKGDEDNLALFFETMAKRKTAEPPTGHRHSKRVKQESL
ncbi:hypothetical protein EKO04_010401 [Ascochyta lentis]|uniref:Uncharacterized protein n=1 Tax=Ascochyta lentis TaxID=205686 RepID=A0A8H7MD52_9PLEO|nr:hypothetical protein EKO04_010401 [Ascochyta lentis]